MDKNDTISSHVKISLISLLSSLSLKLYLNSLVNHQNIFRSSLKVFGNLWTSLEIFRKFLEKIRECSSGLRNNFFWKIFGNLRKVIKKAVITDFYVIKRTLHVSWKI